MKTTKKEIEHVVKELVGIEAMPIIEYLKGKTRISEFIIAEELDIEIHKTRNTLYKLLENNLVSFQRKKDKIKGWYICYWDFDEKNIHFLTEKIRKKKLEKLQERLKQEEEGQFYLCKNACARMGFEKSIEFNFKCPECGEIMNQQNNERTIEFLKEKIKELEKQKPKEKEKKTITKEETKEKKTTKKITKKKNDKKTEKKPIKKTTKKKSAPKKTSSKKKTRKKK